MVKNTDMYELQGMKLIIDEKELADNNLRLKLSKMQLV